MKDDTDPTGQVGLKAISLRNFKGVGDEEVVIPLAPITLLFGANSAGKSTILHALLLIRQILCRGSLELWDSEEGADIGDFRNYVHRHDIERTVEIGVEIGVDDDGLMPIPMFGLEGIEAAAGTTIRMLFQISWHPYEKAPDLGVEIFYDNHFVQALWDDPWGLKIVALAPRLPDVLNDGSRDLPVDWREFVGAYGDQPEFDAEKQRWYFIGIPVEEIDLSPLGLGDSRGVDSEGPSSVHDQASEGLLIRGSPMVSFLYSAAIIPLYDLSMILKDLRHIGPMRKVPPRGFAPAAPRDGIAWSDGMAAWFHLLAPSSSSDRSRIFDAVEQLDLGYHVEEVLQLDSRVDPANLTLMRNFLAHEIDLPERAVEKFLECLRLGYRVVDANGRNIDLQDVGIGVSQVIPVVVAALAPGSTVVALEQPELHIHPRIQCLLADILAKAAIEDGRLLLVETHSEHLMLRFLRRVRETTNNELEQGMPTMTPSGFSVIWVENQGESGTEITSINITSDGDFKERWPSGFFSERRREIF